MTFKRGDLVIPNPEWDLYDDFILIYGGGPFSVWETYKSHTVILEEIIGPNLGRQIAFKASSFIPAPSFKGEPLTDLL